MYLHVLVVFEISRMPATSIACWVARVCMAEIKDSRHSSVRSLILDGRATVVPVHTGEAIGPGLLAKILKDVKMTKNELIKVR